MKPVLTVTRDAVTMAAWIRLENNKGIHSIFDTIGNHSNHRQGQYHLEVKDAALRWFHRNEFCDTVFNVKSGTLCLLVMICHNTDFQLSGSGNGLDLKSEGTCLYCVGFVLPKNCVDMS